MERQNFGSEKIKSDAGTIGNVNIQKGKKYKLTNTISALLLTSTVLINIFTAYIVRAKSDQKDLESTAQQEVVLINKDEYVTDIFDFDNNYEYENYKIVNNSRGAKAKTIDENVIISKYSKSNIYNIDDIENKKLYTTIDLSNSNIDQIAVSLEDIKGAKINQMQAIDLMYLLGVKVVE